MTIIRFGLLALLLTLSQTIAADHIGWEADDIVLPHVKDPTRYVSNPEGVVIGETEKVLNNIMRHLDIELGIESAVVIVNHVKNKDIYGMSQSLFDKYGIGRYNRGLVIILAYEDHLLRTHTGYFLEADLPDALCSRLQQNYAIPALRAFNPDKAMVRLTSAIYYHLKGLPMPNTEEDTLLSENYVNYQNGLYVPPVETEEQTEVEDVTVDYSFGQAIFGKHSWINIVCGIIAFIVGLIMGLRKKAAFMRDEENFCRHYNVQIAIGGILVLVFTLVWNMASYSLYRGYGLYTITWISAGFLWGYYVGGKDVDDSDGRSSDRDGYREGRSGRSSGGYGGGRSGGGGATSSW